MSAPPSPDSALRQRLNALSAGHRLLLAQRLGQLSRENTQTAETAAAAPRLLACVAAAPGTAPRADDLREYLAARLPEHMVPQRIALLDALPRTPAGKLDRRALRERQWDEQPGAAAALQAPRSDAEKTLARIWAEVLGLDEVGVDEDFFELGGDSLLSIRILARAGKEGLKISPEKFFAQPTIAAQAAAAGEVSMVRAEQGLVTGPAPLLPIQHWFFDNVTTGQQQWNQSLLLRLSRPQPAALLERALQALLLHHDGLRLRFEVDAGGWRQRIHDLDPRLPVVRADASAGQAAITAAAIRLNQGLDLQQGPLLQVALLENPQSEVERVLIVAHHLLVDAMSWRILLEDLHAACARLREGRPIELPAKTSSLRQCAERLAELARAPTLVDELAYWSQPRAPGDASLPLDRRADRAANTNQSARILNVELDVADTALLLQETPAALHARVMDLLLAGLLLALNRWTGRGALLFDLEGHGRELPFEDIDPSRTVGWFTTVFPVHLSAPNDPRPVAVLKSVKQQLRSLPNRGLSYGVLREYADDPAARAALRALPRRELCFNFLGQVDYADSASDLLIVEAENIGPLRAARGPRAYLLEINAMVRHQRLCATIAYSESFHDEATMTALGQNLLDAWRGIAGLGRADMPSAAVTPDDFPLARLDQQGLDGLSALLDSIDDDED